MSDSVNDSTTFITHRYCMCDEWSEVEGQRGKE